MRRATSLLLTSFFFAEIASAQDYRPAFDPAQLKLPAGKAANEVAVLGTAHLSGLPATFNRSMVDPVLARLARWRPTAVSTEDLSGLQCDSMRRYPARYAESVKSYCYDPSPAGRALGLDVPAANAEAERILASWPASPSASDRRRLAAVFLAAGERFSSLVQWLRLPAAERRSGDGLTDELVQYLSGLATRQNETTLVAVPLAVRLGHERVWSVDDHTADSNDPQDEEAASAALMKAWDNPATKQRQSEDARLFSGLARKDGLLALYRAYNSPDAARLVYRSDFGAALRDPSRREFGRNYVAYWETRNLRMVANIRDVLARSPGTRMLAIVGASHKGYYEAYLNMMHDVKLVDTLSLLR